MILNPQRSSQEVALLISEEVFYSIKNNQKMPSFSIYSFGSFIKDFKCVEDFFLWNESAWSAMTVKFKGEFCLLVDLIEKLHNRNIIPVDNKSSTFELVGNEDVRNDTFASFAACLKHSNRRNQIVISDNAAKQTTVSTENGLLTTLEHLGLGA